MLKSKLVNSATWYREGSIANYKNSHLVTTASHNPELGIDHIQLQTVESTKPGAPLFRLRLHLTNEVEVTGDIFAQRRSDGLNINLPQESYLVNGETQIGRAHV